MSGYRRLARDVRARRVMLEGRVPVIRRRTDRLRNRLRTPLVLMPAFLGGVIVGRLMPARGGVTWLPALMQRLPRLGWELHLPLRLALGLLEWTYHSRADGNGRSNA